jgi:chromosomal replication initiation ATPase DnaA
MKPNELWTGALCLLEKRTTAFSFEAWLQPLRVEASASGLKLCCPNAFHQGRVRDRFLQEITSCLTEVAATDISVELVVDENPPALSLVQPSTPAPALEPAKKNIISHRFRAILKLCDFLKDQDNAIN